jgi:hypothetical protein
MLYLFWLTVVIIIRLFAFTSSYGVIRQPATKPPYDTRLIMGIDSDEDSNGCQDSWRDSSICIISTCVVVTLFTSP